MVTIKDVAKKSGVSVGSVSRYINLIIVKKIILFRVYILRLNRKLK